MNSRFLTIDGLRLPAAIAIIWLHTVRSPQLEPTSVIGRFAVPFFIAISVFLIFTKVFNRYPKQEKLTRFVGNKFSRICIPFLIWSTFYWLIRYGNCHYLSGCQMEPFGWEILWPNNHLWFLPFLFLTSVSTFFLAHFAVASHIKQWAIFTLALCLGTYIAHTPLRFYIVEPVLVVNALPATLWAVSFSLFYLNVKLQKRIAIPIAYGAIVLFGMITVILLLHGRQIFLENMAGICLLIFAIYVPPLKLFSWLAPLGTYAYGVYLIHLFLVEGLRDVLAKAFSIGGFQGDIYIFALSAILSLSFAITLRKMPRLSTCLGT